MWYVRVIEGDTSTRGDAYNTLSSLLESVEDDTAIVVEDATTDYGMGGDIYVLRKLSDDSYLLREVGFE